MERYDVLVLGGGPGGYVAAIKGAQLGLKVALIEKEAIGGVCLNDGCIPTKTLLKSAKVYKTIQHAMDYGITLDQQSVVPNWSEILSRKAKVVQRLTSGVKGLLKKNGVEVYEGYGEVIDAHTINVNSQPIQAKNLILATGASPIIPPILGLKEAIESNYVYHSKTLLNYKSIPKSLIIVGGGVIGIEFATLFSSFGTQVTILERLDNILMPIDDDIRTAYLKILKRDNIEIITNANVTAFSKNSVTYERLQQAITLKSEIALLSVGMKPNIDAFQSLQLTMNQYGVDVNAQMRTNLPNVYAIGDMTGQMMLAHAASAEGIVAIENIAGKKSSFRFDTVPSAVYGFPEIAWIGITEREAIQKNIAYKTSQFPLLANGRSLAEGETDGFVKILTHPQNGEILGAHIIASNATDLLSETVLAMTSEATIADIANAIHLHPSVGEAVMEAAIGTLLKPIHY